MGSERRRIDGESVLGLVDEHAHEFEGAEHEGDQGLHDADDAAHCKAIRRR
jgi:hypothetical protein